MKMKSLILAAAVILAPLFTPVAHSEPIALETAVGTFVLPFQVVNGTQLYSFKEGKGFPGAETVLYSKGRYQVTFGGAPVLGSDVNVPFVGVQHRLNPAIFDTGDNELQFGVWAGKPSHALEEGKKPSIVWGVKASVPLW